MPNQAVNLLWDRVWDTLDLPKPKFRRFDDRWHWLAWGEWQAYRRQRGDIRWMDRQLQPGVFPEVVALRALDFLREIEVRDREEGAPEELAMGLTVQAVLLERTLAREKEARQLMEETWELGEGNEGWRVRASVEQALSFLNGEGPAGKLSGLLPRTVRATRPEMDSSPDSREN
jgi:hypothetical protein